MQEDLNYKNSSHWTHGYHFLQWGLWFFIFGLIFGFGALIHYLAGSSYNNTGEFLSNITLWFGSPLTLSVHYLQMGGLAMAILGAVCICFSRKHLECVGTNVAGASAVSCPKHKHAGLTLCIIGLIALFITGYIGYFIIDFIWPGFYYIPIQAGKNLWLILQGLSILLFLIGFIIATCCICKCKKEHYQNRV